MGYVDLHSHVLFGLDDGSPDRSTSLALLDGLAALGVTGLFVGYMAWAVVRFVYDSWRFKEVAQGLVKIPIWMPQLCFVFGVLIGPVGFYIRNHVDDVTMPPAAKGDSPIRQLFARQKLQTILAIGDLAPGYYLTAVCLLSLWALITIRRTAADAGPY